MMNDKHIEQHAGYFIEELPSALSIMESMHSGLWHVMVKMYKLGYQDCLEDRIQGTKDENY